MSERRFLDLLPSNFDFRLSPLVNIIRRQIVKRLMTSVLVVALNGLADRLFKLPGVFVIPQLTATNDNDHESRQHEKWPEL